MARIQVLELPTVEVETGRYRTPFALVIDQTESESIESYGGTVRQIMSEDFEALGLKKASGAEFVIVTPHTLDVA